MRRAALAALLLSVCSACHPQTNSAAAAAKSSGSGPNAVRNAPLTTAPGGEPVVRAIKDHLGSDRTLSDKARFTTAFTDLNGDGKNDAVVYLVDPHLCGSGGCVTYVLSQAAADAWKVIDTITITHPPIYKLPAGKDGWAELGVTVSGGGLRRMVMAVPHSADGYAQNPSTPPAHAVDPGKAEVLISTEAVFPQLGT